MRRFVIPLLVLALLGSSAGAQTPRPIDSLAWLVGGVWIADASKLGGGLQRIEVRYEWAPTKNFIRFATIFVSDQGPLVNYAGNIYSYGSGSSETLAMWYMDAKGAITQGNISGPGDRWSLTFDSAAGGKTTTYRVDLVKKAANTYGWTVSSLDGAWKPLFSLDYIRSAHGLTATPLKNV